MSQKSTKLFEFMKNQNIRIKSYLLFLIIIIFYYLNYSSNIHKKKYNNINYEYEYNENIFQTNSNSQNFVFNANWGILTQNIPIKNYENPKISVVIPVLNSENFIHRTILSIQNQNFSDFEIVVINDYSIDNSFKIMKKLSEQDKRIKIINNTKHMGQFYSRCVGTLLSKGKYVLPLDSDDMFLIHDLFYILYNELKTNKPDMLKFRGIKTLNINSFLNNQNISLFRGYIKKNQIINQPYLSKNSYKKCSLQSTCIISELFKNVVNYNCKNYLYEHITYYEDCIINYYILQFARNCEQILKIGYLYVYRPGSNSHTEKYLNKMKGEIYYYETIFENSNALLQHKLLVIQALFKLSKKNLYQKLLEDDTIRKKLDLVFEKIMSDKSISKSNKTLLNNFFSK